MALYTATATSTGGRNGHTKSHDGVIDMPLSIPKSMGGEGKPGATNPEELFACGYSACFGQALMVVAGQHKLKPQQIQVTAEVSIDKKPEGGFILATVLTGHLPGISQDEARTLMDEAHKICPYSNATRGNMNVELRVA
jgi:Ohr subfamily peroxiredoxin